MKKLFGFIILFFSATVMAAQFKGFSANAENKKLKMSEELDQFTESKEEFLINFKKHPSFYSFPKKKDQEDQVRNFLKDRLKNKKVVTVEVDSVTTKILSLGDKEK